MNITPNTTLTVEDTTRSYSGGPGCMCGCQGKYNESTRARKMAITQILKGFWTVEDFNRTDDDGVRGCVYVTNTHRNRVLYLTESGVAKAQTLKAEEEAVLGHS